MVCDGRKKLVSFLGRCGALDIMRIYMQGIDVSYRYVRSRAISSDNDYELKKNLLLLKDYQLFN